MFDFLVTHIGVILFIIFIIVAWRGLTRTNRKIISLAIEGQTQTARLCQQLQRSIEDTSESVSVLSRRIGLAGSGAVLSSRPSSIEAMLDGATVGDLEDLIPEIQMIVPDLRKFLAEVVPELRRQLRATPDSRLSGRDPGGGDPLVGRIETMVTKVEEILRKTEALRTSEDTETSDALVAEVRAGYENVLAELHNARKDLYASRHILSHSRREEVESDGHPHTFLSAPHSRTLDQSLSELKARAPYAYPLWYELLGTNAAAYELHPEKHCSVIGNALGDIFASYLKSHLRGNVLDVGCGPQPTPVYLKRYPVERIAGIDPIGPWSEGHPYLFCQGVAEFLPWDDVTFDVVVAAGSLDCFLLLDRGLQEIRRVLKPDGVFVVWVTFQPNACRYDPHTPAVKKVDESHLFRFDRDWFEEIVSEYFDVREVTDYRYPASNHFYCLSPRLRTVTRIENNRLVLSKM